jgi:hypothetical protein
VKQKYQVTTTRPKQCKWQETRQNEKEWGKRPSRKSYSGILSSGQNMLRFPLLSWPVPLFYSDLVSEARNIGRSNTHKKFLDDFRRLLVKLRLLIAVSPRNLKAFQGLSLSVPHQKILNASQLFHYKLYLSNTCMSSQTCRTPGAPAGWHFSVPSQFEQRLRPAIPSTSPQSTRNLAKKDKFRRNKLRYFFQNVSN